jgi:c-di-AMP phosphodiesterase-like protein
MRLFFFLLVIFAALTYFFAGNNYYLAVAETVVIILLGIYTLADNRRRTDKLAKYIETVSESIGSASENSLARSPLPVAVFYADTGNIIWANEGFNTITGSRKHFFEIGVGDLVPGFSYQWLRDGKIESPETVAVGDRHMRVYGTMLRAPARGDSAAYICTTYWLDVSRYEEIAAKYADSRLVAAIIAIDNYEEILKNLSERDKSTALSDIDGKLQTWTGEIGGFLRKYDRDRYLFVCEERNAAKFPKDKFSVLEAVREIEGAGGTRASLSIGAGRGAETLGECVRFAQLALEMALARGGDQAVIKDERNFEFFGGSSAEHEKRTKVRSRVMSTALGQLIADASSVYVMGHRNGDYDCVGAAAGICRIAFSLGIPAFIVADETRTMSAKLIASLRESPDFAGAFLTPTDALITADARTLLVVVDTSRPEEVESLPLLEACARVAVIDHHRRAATFIENAVFNYNEPYASSASELVTEMLQYLVETGEIRKAETDALLAGIVLDTKTFSIHTGSRTFDAASFLRRAGAETTDVKSLMQSDYQTAMQRFEIVRNAKVYKGGVAIAVSEKDESRVSVAQAADELLTIEGVTCSFVISTSGEDVVVSARSIGRINVQLVLEKLGGGGNQSIAGATVRSTDIETASQQLLRAIDEHLTDIKAEEIHR